MSAEGEHTVEHRATDVAGNVGEPGTVAFSIDAGGGSGAPEIEAFADPSVGRGSATRALHRDRARPGRRRAQLPLDVRRQRRAQGDPNYTFRTAGEHTATVTATDNKGETASKTMT